MPINFDRAFGIHEQALALRAYRSGILASNMANADTPNYKARDIDFGSALAAAAREEPGPMGLRVTRARHIPTGSGPTGSVEIGYRVPLQPSVDGNTVDTDVEQSAFAENALRYQVSLNILSGRIRGILTAITGE